ncbi:hypothetical protein N7445_007167 [Penicillium cf. griseofulvum]|nr:hypothetical protein N7445_007167 [Penicillium cf. griseofulvum]
MPKAFQPLQHCRDIHSVKHVKYSIAASFRMLKPRFRDSLHTACINPQGPTGVSMVKTNSDTARPDGAANGRIYWKGGRLGRLDTHV